MSNDNRNPYDPNEKINEQGLDNNSETASEQANNRSIESEYERSTGPTYYSYGTSRPNTANPNPSQSNDASAGNAYSAPSSAADNQPYSQPYTAQPMYGQSPYMQPQQHPQLNEQAVPNTQGSAAPYRQYIGPSANGEFQANNAKNVKKEKKSFGFGKMFMSFMAGVLAVGLLMYTADVQNWFSAEQAASQSANTKNSSNGSTSNTSQGSTNRTTSMMTDRPDNIADLFKSSSPAVVKIETYTQRTRSSGSILDDPFFRQFFGYSVPDTKKEQSTGEMVQTGMGTGFFFDEEGYILTNQHVVADGDKINVIVEGYDEPFEATLLGNNYDLDLAVLKVEGKEAFPILPLGDSNSAAIGDWVVAIGNPYGFDHTLTVGVISAKERPIDISDSEGTRNYTNLIQTDASINPGNSGGPLLNLNGEVIGINTAVSSTAQGIGFAIPTSTIFEVLDALKNNEQPKLPFIGANLIDMTEQLAEQFGLEKAEGTIVGSVYFNSPAYMADLKEYDVIIGVDDKSIKNAQELIDHIKSKEIGDEIELKIIRKGQEMKLTVTIGNKNDFNL